MQPNSTTKVPTIRFIAADGSPLPDDTSAVAFLLPGHGLMFDLAVVQARNHDDAIAKAAACRVLGFEDWTLPNDQELSLLINRDHYKPATHPELAKHTRFDDWYWTSKVHASDAVYAWCVDFAYGYVNHSHRNLRGFVRPVRRVPASQ